MCKCLCDWVTQKLSGQYQEEGWLVTWTIYLCVLRDDMLIVTVAGLDCSPTSGD